jgi:RNA polymerase sigma-70 factor, ECF subfamily
MSEPAQIGSKLELTDEELARRARAGSFPAFEALVQRYEERLYRFLRGCTGNDADARDLAQAVFVTAYQALGQYRSTRAFGPWLFTIARHKFIDHYRAHRSRVISHDPQESTDPDDPATVLSRREEQADFWARVRGLVSVDQFQALWLHYHEEMSVRDIAKALNRTVVGVKVLLFRARQILLRRLSSNPELVPAKLPTAKPAPAEPLRRALAGRTR